MFFCDVVTVKYNFIIYNIEKDKIKGVSAMAAINMNKDMFLDKINNKENLLVDFWAPWCTYCRRINAAYDMIAEENEGKIVVAKINIDEESELSDRENIEIVPTLVMYKDGKAVGSVVAPKSKAEIDEFIRKTLNS